MTEREQIAERLREVLNDADVRLAILFGSAARGELTETSDVDVGIVPTDTEVPLAWELELQGRLTRACGRTVDLLRLDTASPLVRWEVARSGRCLRSTPAHEFARFTARAALEHADLRPALDRAAELFRQRVARGGAP